MNSDGYSEFKKTLEANGLTLHPALERKNVGGVWGMYATAPIACGTVLARCPRSALITLGDTVYPEGTSVSAKNIHRLTRLRQTSAEPLHQCFSQMFEPLEQLRDYSTYFCDEAELRALWELSPASADLVGYDQVRKRALVNAIRSFDSELDENLLLETMLNYTSRAVGDVGIVPMLDLFNHSDTHGRMFIIGEDRIEVQAHVDIAAGEQAFISYGRLDVLDHAVSYNYFDPSNESFLRFGRRETFPLNDVGRQLQNRLSQHYKTKEDDLLKRPLFYFADDRLLLSAKGPTQALMQFFIDFGMRANENRPPQQIMAETMMAWLDALSKNNHVGKHKSNPLPKRLERFYAVLQREQEIVNAARRWLTS